MQSNESSIQKLLIIRPNIHIPQQDTVGIVHIETAIFRWADNQHQSLEARSETQLPIGPRCGDGTTIVFIYYTDTG